MLFGAGAIAPAPMAVAANLIEKLKQEGYYPYSDLDRKAVA